MLRLYLVLCLCRVLPAVSLASDTGGGHGSSSTLEANGGFDVEEEDSLSASNTGGDHGRTSVALGADGSITAASISPHGATLGVALLEAEIDEGAHMDISAGEQLHRSAGNSTGSDVEEGEDHDPREDLHDRYGLPEPVLSVYDVEHRSNSTSMIELSSGRDSRRRRRRFQMLASYSYDFNGSYFDEILDMTEGRLGGPISIEFHARWDKFVKWSRILDFGAGPRDNNIIVSLSAIPGELAFFIYLGPLVKGLKVPNAVEIGVPANFLLTISDTGRMKVWKNGKIIGETFDGNVPKKVYRNNFYIGKSAMTSTRLFHGSIKDLYIWNGEAHAWGKRDVSVI